jgi:type II secretory pathway pseudopilin PulG
MTTPRPFRSLRAEVPRRRNQKGYVLLVILFMLAALTIALMATGQAVATQIKRDREEEMVHRGQQYVKAIRRYYRKFGRYPSKIEDLESANNIRFLRRRYKDPMVPNGEWKVLHYGEAKNPPRGLFGQPIGVGTGLGGSTPGVNTVGGQPAGGLGGSPAGGTGTMSAPGAAASPPQTSDNGDANSSVNGSSNGNPAATENAPGSSSTQVQTFGGGAIIGVESLSTKESLKEIAGKNHYNEWEFVYDPRVEALVGGAGQAGQIPVQQQNGQGLGNTMNQNQQNPQTPQSPQSPQPQNQPNPP